MGLVGHGWGLVGGPCGWLVVDGEWLAVGEAGSRWRGAGWWWTEARSGGWSWLALDGGWLALDGEWLALYGGCLAVDRAG